MGFPRTKHSGSRKHSDGVGLVVAAVSVVAEMFLAFEHLTDADAFEGCERAALVVRDPYVDHRCLAEVDERRRAPAR